MPKKIDIPKRYPHLFDEWDIEKNERTIDDYGNLKYRAWWRCNTCNFSWQSQIETRIEGTKCPVCAKKPPYLKSLAYRFPELDNMIHSNRNVYSWANGKISGIDLYCRSDHEIWWECECGYEFKRTIRSQVFNSKYKCPRCKKDEIRKDKSIIIDGYDITNQILHGLLPEQYIELMKYQNFKCWLSHLPFKYIEEKRKFVDTRIRMSRYESKFLGHINDIYSEDEKVWYFFHGDTLISKSKKRSYGLQIILPEDELNNKIAPSIDHCHDKGHIRAILNGYVNTLEHNWIDLAYPQNLKEIDLEKYSDLSREEYILSEHWDDNKTIHENYKDFLGFEIDFLRLEEYYIKSPVEKLFGKINYR